MAMTLEIESNLIPRFSLKGKDLPVDNAIGREDDVKTASLHIDDESPNTTLT
jgi:hypothetical protein